MSNDKYEILFYFILANASTNINKWDHIVKCY